MKHLSDRKIETDLVDIYYLKGLINDPVLLQTLIDIIDQKAEPSTVAENGERRTTDFRTSQTCYLNEYECDATKYLQRIITNALRIPEQFSEQMQGQKYEVGQYFKEHTDFFEKGGKNYDVFTQNGNQRTWTFMIYLNDVEEGGFTRFPQLKLQFKPKAGDAILWNNLDENGNENDWTSHQAIPPESGKKYIITQWYRQQVYRDIQQPSYKIPTDRLSRPCGGAGGFDDFVERWHQ